MVLLDNVVEILTLPDRDGCRVSRIVVGNRGRVTATLIHRHLLRESLSPNRLVEERLGRVPIATRRLQEVNGVTFLVHGAIQVLPLSFQSYVSLIHPPASAHRLLPPPKLLFKLRGILDDPAVKGRMIDSHAVLLHHLFQLAVTDRVGNIRLLATSNQKSTISDGRVRSQQPS